MNILQETIKHLFESRGNYDYCCDINVDQNELQEILETPSKHKNLIKGTNPCNVGYITVKLTTLGIRYYENGFKFDHEKQLIPTQQIDARGATIGNIGQNSGTINITPATLSIEDIEKVKSIITHEYNHHKEILNLLNEYQRTLVAGEVPDESIIKKAATYIGTFNDVPDFVNNLKSMGQHILTLFAKYSPEIQQFLDMYSQ